MPVNWTNIPISLQGGLDTKTDFKQVVPGKLNRLENGVFTSLKEISKRNGYNSVPLSLTSGKMISFYNNELITVDNTSLYSYSQELGNNTLKGPFLSTEVSLVSVIKNNQSQTNINAAWSSTGLYLATWLVGSGGAAYSIIDSITGDNIVYNISITNAIAIRPFVLGNFFIIVYGNSASSQLFYISIPLATPTLPNAPVQVSTDAALISFAVPNWDACVISTRLFIGWDNGVGPTNFSAKYLDTSLTLSAETKYAASSALGGGSNLISMWGDSVLQQVWVSYNITTATVPGLGYLVIPFNLAVTPVLAATVIDAAAGTATFVLDTITGYASNGIGQVWYNTASSLNNSDVETKTTPLNNLGTGIAPVFFVFGLNTAAKVFVYNSIPYIPMIYYSPPSTPVINTVQPTIFILGPNARAVAKILPGTASSITDVNRFLPETTSQIAGKFMIPVAQVDLLNTIGTTIYTQSGATLAFVNFLSNNTYYKSVVGGNLNISGGVTWCYDGQHIVEQNFNLFPEGTAITQSNSGGELGNASVATLYSYIATYEWTDNQGQVQRSATSIVTPKTQASFASGITTGSVTITFTTLKVTQKTNVSVVLYRTAGNGTIFYQVTPVYFPVVSDPTIATVSYTDTTSDADIIGNSVLYTNGGVVDNSAPPASFYLTSYQDRLILIPSENRNEFWFTKSLVPGTPPEFSETFTWNVDSRGGNLTGCQQLDDKLILFKENNILYMLGEGPGDTGSQNDFTTAQLLPFDVGCNNAKSIISYPDGLIFQSNKGIWKLDRGLHLSYIGADVEFYNNNRITSTSTIPNTTQLRFTLDSGVCLVYDYYVGQWAVFTNINAQDSTVFEDLFTYIQPDGGTRQETIGSYTDNGAFIRLYILTSWLSFAQLQGFSRMKRLLILGDWLSAHNLIVNVFYDFNSSATQTTTLLAPSLVTPYEWRLDLEQQKSTAIQFSLEDSQTMPFGAGLTISNFNFMAGIKQGSNKLAPSRIYA